MEGVQSKSAPFSLLVECRGGLESVIGFLGQLPPSVAPTRLSLVRQDGRGPHRISLAVYELTFSSGVPPGSVVIGDPHVSSAHARIVVQGDAATIEDLGSKNHTFVRNERVTGPHPLQPGDGIRLGGPTVIFRRGTPKTVTVTSTRKRS